MVPCKVYYPRMKGPSKAIVATNQAELDALLRIGWKLEDPAQ